MMEARDVFVTGGTGYIGRGLIAKLILRGHRVRALARPGSESRLPAGCEVVIGDALDRATFTGQIQPADTLVHLVGVAHPSPAKVRQFETIDLVSIRESVAAAVERRITHLVYVSVAQPAPVMKAFIRIRAEGEAMIRKSGLNATILRPWYVLGPGHRWPCALLPFYWLLERIPSTRESARRLGLVTWRQMVAALLWSIENPAAGIRILGVAEVRVGGCFHDM